MANQWMPGDPLPGTDEPEPNKCGSCLRRSLERYGEARYCGRPAGWGTRHPGIGKCKLHGGASPNHEASAGKEMARREIMSLSERLGRPIPIEDPDQELLNVAGEFSEFRTILREKLDEIGSLDVTDVQGISRIKGIVSAYQEALRDTERVLVSIQRLDLGRRKQEVSEKMAELLATAMLGVILDVRLGLNDSQVQVGRQVLAEKLTELSPASNIIDLDPEDEEG